MGHSDLYLFLGQKKGCTDTLSQSMMFIHQTAGLSLEGKLGDKVSTGSLLPIMS